MGNSGSMNGLPGYDDATAYHHPGYHHQYQRYHEMMRANGGNSGGPAPAWLESYQRDLRNGRSTFDNRHHHHDSGTHRDSTVSSGPSLPPPMKVLPDIPGRVAKLRPTNNGNILHSGGTISKNNNLQRSKSISSPTYQQHQKQSSFDEAEENGGPLNSLPPRMTMMRSKTQFNMMGGGRPRDFDDSRRGYATNQRKPSYEHGTLNKKRFGSEPDLRLSMAAELQQEQEAGPAGHRNTKPVQSKIMKGKNKKKAPVPPAADKREPEPIEKHQPQLQQQQQRIIAYSPLRKTNSDASSTLPSSDSNSNNPTRKLRLFKTRAETKKNIITKLPEASDAKYQAKPAASSNGQLKMRVSPTNSGSGTQPYKPPRKDPDFDTSTLDKPKSRLNPTSFFRREKTFDLGILERDRHVQQPEVKPTMSPPISRRKSIVKSLLEKDQKEQQQLRQQEQSRIASVEPKFKPKVQEEKRKPSQPQAAVTPVMTDFQKELAMATRRKTALGGSNPNLAQTKPAPTGAANPQRKMSEVTKQTIKVEPAPPTPTQTKTNSLVISVEPPKQDDREKLSISPPPPPPPLPKTSFYFGMTAPKKSPEPKISPTLLVKAKMLETRVDTEPESSSSEDEAKRPLDSPSDDSEMDKTQLDVIDRFAASLLNGTKFQSGSDSAASSEVDVRTTSGIELFTEGQEISLKLRPTLPRKNFEIPRFSPAAAWRLLTTEDDFGRDSTELFPFADQKKTQLLRSLEAVDAAAEDRIERIYREPIPGLQDNKSGDSGISGDAGLPDLGEAQMMNSSKERDSPESSPVDDGGVGVGVGGTNGWSASAIRLTPWTPQQDLEDDDDTTGSSVDNRQLIEEAPLSGGGPNDFSSKGHLFSLSLPRENHLSIYTGTAANGEKVEKHMFNSLQKLRKSVSDAFTSEAELSPLESGDNWFLSRLDSSPPAITNAYEKRQLSPTGPKQTPPEAPSSAGSAGSKKNDSNEQLTAKPTKHLPIGYLISGKHMMYLPKEATKVVVTSGKNDANNNSLPTEVSPPLATMSSYQSRSGYGADRRRDNKENMQDPVPDENGGAGEMEKFPVKISNRKNHRFTFQSTIRQIEKRRVAEKLSREAEIKEAMRLSELEAMRRVEEEFQKKRAREKASIRHQLRLFSMEEGGNGQAFEGNEDDELPELIKRAEPEGDSMPHQPSSTTATTGKSNGMFRKRDATLERQTYLNGGGQARRLSQSRFHQTSTLERKYNPELDQDFNEDENDSDDDDVDSSLGYIDTRTPYISRIIQAKSSKSGYGGGGLKK